MQHIIWFNDKGHLIWDYIFIPVIGHKKQKNISSWSIKPFSHPHQTRNLGVTLNKKFICSISGRNWILEWQNKIKSSILPNSKLQNVNTVKSWVSTFVYNMETKLSSKGYSK